MTPTEFRIAVATNIKTYRIRKRLTQEDMEDDGMNVRTYQRIENATTDISLEKLFIISRKLEVKPGKLVDVL